MMKEKEIIKLEVERLGLLPCEDVTPKVAITGSLLEDGVLQLQVLDDSARPKVEVLLDDFVQLCAGLVPGSVVKHRHG